MTADSETLQINPIPLGDFILFLHELRSRELRQIPFGAQTVLSAGCSGSAYFKWFSDNYPSVKHHIGVEAYLPCPTDMPQGTEWIARTVGNIEPVSSHSVDLIFAGQVIEHLWPEDTVNFLGEVRRILKPGGRFVLDSPNRRITEAFQWRQPEHTCEYTPDEMVSILSLAGFQDISIRGIWLCYDRDSHSFLPLYPDQSQTDWSWEKRVLLSNNRPEDCFIWWIEAVSGNLSFDRGNVEKPVYETYERVRPANLRRFSHVAGRSVYVDDQRLITSASGEVGYLLHGPYVPLRKGKYQVSFTIRRDALPGNEPLPDEIACTLDCSFYNEVIATRNVKCHDLSTTQFSKIPLTFTLPDTTFGVEFRIFSTGRLSLTTPLFALLEDA